MKKLLPTGLIVSLMMVFVAPANSETMETAGKNIKNFCEKRHINKESQKICFGKQFSSYIQVLKICDKIVYIKGRLCNEMDTIRKILVNYGSDINEAPGGARWVNTDWEMALVDIIKELNKLNKKEN